jgi:hypothetical protein
LWEKEWLQSAPRFGLMLGHARARFISWDCYCTKQRAHVCTEACVSEKRVDVVREDGAATCVDYCESEFLFCSLSLPILSFSVCSET